MSESTTRWILQRRNTPLNTYWYDFMSFTEEDMENGYAAGCVEQLHNENNFPGEPELAHYDYRFLTRVDTVKDGMYFPWEPVLHLGKQLAVHDYSCMDCQYGERCETGSELHRRVLEAKLLEASKIYKET